ncbi:MAG: DUF4062 domain-containing protein [Bryobacteraceae bacterium]|nr:DUF4062 domain-containing protein [Bryobacteraceae bacterium]
MARPRVFISSTFYDLRQVRADIERFVRELGYEPVRHERGQVPYGSGENLEQYCYKEIYHVDIVINIVGGRFGSMSLEHDYSISQMELKTAHRLNKQCYIFVDAAVMSEYRMYLRNKPLAGMKYVASDDERILKFIEEIEALPRNNQLIEFRHSEEIVGHLREQWAGLFQRFLQQQELLPERRAADELHTALTTVKDLVKFLTNERREQGSSINEILLSNHPIFERLRKVTDTPYLLFFRTRENMHAWLRARSWIEVDEDHWDSPSVPEWVHGQGKRRRLLTVADHVFDDAGRLKIFTSAEWNDDWVTVNSLPEPSPASTQDTPPSDVPF